MNEPSVVRGTGESVTSRGVAPPAVASACPGCDKPAPSAELGVAQIDGVWHKTCWTASFTRHMGVAPFPHQR